MKKLSLNILILLPLLFGTAKLGAQVSIGADKAPQSFSVLELVAQYKAGTVGGLRLPQLSTDERNSITGLSDPEAFGLMIYNTDNNCVEFWNSVKWISYCEGETPPIPPPFQPKVIYPEAPEGDFCLSGRVCFDVMESEGGDSCGYLSARTSDFSEPTRTYTLYGDASEIKFYILNDDEWLVQDLTPTDNTVVVTFRPDVNTVMTEKKGKFTLLVQFKNNITGEYLQRSLLVRVQDCMCGCLAKKSACSWMLFMCYNLGAHDDVKALTPRQQQELTAGAEAEKNYGDWYQWGRKADGHEKRSSNCWPFTCGTSGNGSVSSWDSDGQVICCDPPYGYFILNSVVSPYNWRTSQDNKLWDKNENGTSSNNPLKYEGNDPCPAGWRVPTYNELLALTSTTLNTRSTWQSSNTPGYLLRPNDPGSTEWTIFLSATGYRRNIAGTPYNVNTTGYYWSSSTVGGVGSLASYAMTFSSGGFLMWDNTNRATAYSVRCVAIE